MWDIYQILGRDHDEILGLLAQLEVDPRRVSVDAAARRHLTDHLVAASSRHEAREELAFWPVVRRWLASGGGLADRGLAQEGDAKAMLDALRFAPADEEAVGQVRELAGLVRSHIAFEQDEVWPALRRATGRAGAWWLGARFRLAARNAPTRPHPRGPDRPLGLATKGTAVAMADRLRDKATHRRTHHLRPADVEATTDAISLLSGDHAQIGDLLNRLEKTDPPDPAATSELVKQLSIHDAVEREFFYPLVRLRLDAGNGIAGRSLDEHGEVAARLAEVDRRPDDDPYRRHLLNELSPLVRKHFAEEEGDLFPALRARMSAEGLAELGEKMAAARAKAPTRPHRWLGGTGAGTRLSRLVSRPVDRARDALSGRT